MSLEVADNLRDALDVLRERGWTKHKLVSDDGSVCARGAIGVARSGTPRRQYSGTPEAVALADVIREQWPEWSCTYVDISVSSFNDAPDTTFEDIERCFEKAIVEAEGRV